MSALQWHPGKLVMVWLVAPAVIGCVNNPLGSSPGPNLSGTWSGSSAYPTLIVTLASDSCTLGAPTAPPPPPRGCMGGIVGGAYSDTGVALGGAIQTGGFLLEPPAGSGYSSPLPGWSIRVTPVDTINAQADIHFTGTFATSTTIVGTIIFLNTSTLAGVADTFAMTLSKH